MTPNTKRLIQGIEKSAESMVMFKKVGVYGFRGLLFYVGGWVVGVCVGLFGLLVVVGCVFVFFFFFF
ncbi:hypothetical protein OFN26_27855, partial [Escherichia coli]|nr:hypothetical protein [Escherichia coli]